MEQSAQFFFSPENRVAPLGIVAMEGAQELADKIEAHLVRWANQAGMNIDTFRIGCSCPRFSSGDGKGILESSVRGYDLYFVVDVGNYSCTYKYFGQENHMSPDDHYQDLKRLIQAAMGKAHRITVVMPLLYGGRQHRRSYRESLDCAFALQELQSMGVDNVVTFDAVSYTHLDVYKRQLGVRRHRPESKGAGGMKRWKKLIRAGLPGWAPTRKNGRAWPAPA